MAEDGETSLFLRVLARMPPDALWLDGFGKRARKETPEHFRTSGQRQLHLGF